MSGKGQTPVFGLVVSSLLLSGLMLMNYNSSLVDQFNQVLLLATLTTLVPYAFSAAAQLQMLFQDRELFNPRHLARDAAIAALAFGYAFWMMWGAGEEIIAKGFLLLTAGIPVYVFLKWRQRRPVYLYQRTAQRFRGGAIGDPLETSNRGFSAVANG